MAAVRSRDFPATLRVLHIEDEPQDARLFLTQLKRDGHPQVQVTQVASLRGAKHALEQGPQDVALLDLMLPDEEGLSSILVLQSQAPLLPIVVYTGLEGLGMARDSILSGASDYAVKGHTDIQTLVRKLYTALDRHELKRSLYSQLAVLTFENQQLLELAYHDPLTCLYNRRGLERRLDAQKDLHGPDSYATLIDVDDLKGINARQGFHVGDLVLQEVAQCMTASGQGKTLLARLNDDDFLTLGHGGKEEAEAHSKALTFALRAAQLARLPAASQAVTFKQSTRMIGHHRGDLDKILATLRKSSNDPTPTHAES